MRKQWRILRASFLTQPEVERLLRWLADADPRDRAIISTLLGAGLRNSELCALRVDDLDTGAGTLRIPKDRKTDRTIYISYALSALLAERARGRTASDPLIPNARGRRFTPTVLYRRVRRALTAAGFGEVASVQLLRHTYGVMAYRATGGNLLYVQRQMGHAHPMVTAVYAEWAEENPRALTERVARGLGLSAEAAARSITASRGSAKAEAQRQTFNVEWD